MAHHKQLRELLVDDQEPFFLDAYISDCRRQLDRTMMSPAIHRKSDSFAESLLKSCFTSSSSSLSQYDNPKSPVLLLTTKTAGSLLKAALRIENLGPKGYNLPDDKKQGKSATGVGTVELLFRKLTACGRRSRKKEFGGSEGGDRVRVRDILMRNNSAPGDGLKQGEGNTYKKRNRYSRNCPCRDSDSTDEPSGSEGREGREPLNVVGKSSFDCPAPELRPATGSSCRSALEDNIDNGERNPQEIRPSENRAEEKEQSSPVSVLDPPSFDEDDVMEEHDYRDDDGGYGLEYAADCFDYDSSHAKHYGTKQMLLRKLYRFERLVGLDAVELEDGGGGARVSSGTRDARKMRVTKGMMKTVADLIAGEQEMKESDIEMGGVRGCFRHHETSRRKRRDQQDHHSLEDTASEIELAILGYLIKELLSEDSFTI